MQGAMQLGKTPRLDITSNKCSRPMPYSPIFYQRFTHTYPLFLVDTGSKVSIVPPSSTARKHPPDKLTLAAVNDTPIRTYGKVSHPQPWTQVCIAVDIRSSRRTAANSWCGFLKTFWGRHEAVPAERHSHTLQSSGYLRHETSSSPSIISKDANNQYLSSLGISRTHPGVFTRDTYQTQH